MCEASVADWVEGRGSNRTCNVLSHKVTLWLQWSGGGVDLGGGRSVGEYGGDGGVGRGGREKG